MNNINSNNNSAASTISSLLKDNISNIIFCVITIILAFIAIKALKKFIDIAFEKSNLKNSIFPNVLKKIVKYVIIFVAIILMLSKFNIPLTAVFVIISSAIMGLGIALKDFVSNIAKSIQIKLTHPFVIGDVIEVDSKKGCVKKISYTHTHIITKDNTYILVPNFLISDKSIIKYSQHEPL